MYNTVKEMHIALDQGLQQVNSNRKQSISPEEKDMYLNDAVLRFIETRSNPKTNIKQEGFEESRKRYDDLQEIKRSATLPVYIDSSYIVKSFLPIDYLKLVNSRSILEYNCHGVTYARITPIDISYVELPFGSDTTTNVLKYGNFQIVKDNTIIFKLSDYPIGVFNNAQSKFQIINVVLEKLNNLTSSTGVYVYWERYGDIYSPNNFILVGNVTTSELTYDGYTSRIISAKTFTLNGVISPFLSTYERPNEDVSSTVVYDMLNNYYYNRNRHKKPLSTIENDMIKVFYDVNFIIKEVKIDYLKKPTLINYKLETICELTKREEIVSMAIAKIKAEISDPNYEFITNENKIKE